MKLLIRLLVILMLFLPSFSSAGELALSAGPFGSDSWEIGSYITLLFDGSEKNFGISIKIVPSTSPLQDIKRLSSGAADLAVVDALSLYKSGVGKTHGSIIYNLSMIGIEVEHFILFSNLTGKRDIIDLSGKTIYLGPDGDIQRYGAVMITDSLGFSTSGDGGGKLDTDTATELMIDGVFDGGIFCGVPPISHIVRLRSIMGKNASLLEVPEEVHRRIHGICPIWFEYTIPAGIYPGQDEPVKTIARPILLLATERLDDITARAIVSEIFGGKDRFSSPFAPIPITIDMNIENVTTTPHPGAASYYEKRGIEISAGGERK